MERTYLFNNGNGRYIINDERSKIGYSYPRVFVENKATGKYTNLDLCLGCAFKQKKSDFESWIDGNEICNADAKEICTELGINYDAIMEVITELQIESEVA